MEWNNYVSEIKKALNHFEFDREILDILKNSIKNNQKIFVAGNGGSANTANHYVCDLSKGANPNWAENPLRFRALSLSSNWGYISAIANDSSYEEIFKQQLVNLASPSDIGIFISASGNSPNIVRAAEYAKQLEMVVIGITGFDGGKLKKISDYSAHIGKKSYEVCEDIHSMFGHFLACYLKNS